MACGPLAFVVIGGAFLAVTGGEGVLRRHGAFGPLPIRAAWFGVALPALTLNYFGQGGLLLTRPGDLDSPFYELAPELGPLRPGRARDRRDGDRLAVDHFRRLFP